MLYFSAEEAWGIFMESGEFEFLKLLENQEQFIQVPADTVLFREGDEGDRMYIILEGQVHLSINGQDLSTEVDGGFVGEMALIDEVLRTATARTLTKCLLAPLDLDAFTRLIQKKPEFSIHVMQVLAKRLRDSNEFLKLF